MYVPGWFQELCCRGRFCCRYSLPWQTAPLWSARLRVIQKPSVKNETISRTITSPGLALPRPHPDPGCDLAGTAKGWRLWMGEKVDFISAFGGWCCHVGPFVDGPSANTPNSRSWFWSGKKGGLPTPGHERAFVFVVCSYPHLWSWTLWPKKTDAEMSFCCRGGQRVPSTRRSSEKSCCSSTKGASDAPWMSPGCPRTRWSDWATQLVCSPRNPAQDKWKKMDGWLNGQHIYEARIKKKVEYNYTCVIFHREMLHLYCA